MKTKLAWNQTIECKGCTKECSCDHNYHVDKHHVFFGTGLRKLSDKYNCVAYMCHWRHQYDPRCSPHMNREARDKLCAEYQTELEEQGWTREEFMEEFGMSYI